MSYLVGDPDEGEGGENVPDDGRGGGRVLYQGNLKGQKKCKDSYTAKFL